MSAQLELPGTQRWERLGWRARGSYMRLVAAIRTRACAGRVSGARRWSTVRWCQELGVEKRAAHPIVAAGLARWDGDDFELTGYVEHYREFQARIGRKGGFSKAAKGRVSPENQPLRSSGSQLRSGISAQSQRNHSLSASGQANPGLASPGPRGIRSSLEGDPSGSGSLRGAIPTSVRPALRGESAAGLAGRTDTLLLPAGARRVWFAYNALRRPRSLLGLFLDAWRESGLEGHADAVLRLLESMQRTTDWVERPGRSIPWIHNWLRNYAADYVRNLRINARRVERLAPGPSSAAWKPREAWPEREQHR
jgi:hypothetical protein